MTEGDPGGGVEEEGVAVTQRGRTREAHGCECRCYSFSSVVVRNHFMKNFGIRWVNSS